MAFSASTLLHDAIGSPRVEECFEHEGACWVCGADMIRGMSVQKWIAGNFTGSDRIRRPDATHVCESCCYVMARLSPVPGRPPKEGSECGANFRNFSHMVDDHEYVNASKGEKPCVRRWLRGRKHGAWFAAIADSGQKHVVPFAPVNPPGAVGGIILFEEAVVQLPRDDAGWRVVDELARLLTDGATKDSVTSGAYTPGEYQRCADAIFAFERSHASLRASPWFALCVWLAQRDEEAVAARMAAEREAKSRGKTKRANESGTAEPNSVSAPRLAFRLSRKRSESAQTLGPNTGPHASGNANNIVGAGVGHGRRKGAANWNPDQLRMFER